MKLTAGTLKLDGHAWILFNDGAVLRVTPLCSRRGYLAVLSTEDGSDTYGWHQIPGSCMRIPTQCRNWRQVKFAVTEHAKQHGGIYVNSYTV